MARRSSIPRPSLRPFRWAFVSVLVGVALTLPISSAALCIMMEFRRTRGRRRGAGCCANMIGFAVMSFKENGWGAPGAGSRRLCCRFRISCGGRRYGCRRSSRPLVGPISTMVFRRRIRRPTRAWALPALSGSSARGRPSSTTPAPCYFEIILVHLCFRLSSR